LLAYRCMLAHTSNANKPGKHIIEALPNLNGISIQLANFTIFVQHSGLH
jgi:hypothetical protein